MKRLTFILIACVLVAATAATAATAFAGTKKNLQQITAEQVGDNVQESSQQILVLKRPVKANSYPGRTALPAAAVVPPKQ